MNRLNGAFRMIILSVALALATAATAARANLPPGPIQCFVCSPPQIQSISPAFGEQGTTITLTGSHFTNVGEVDFGSTSLQAGQFNVVNDSTIVIPYAPPGAPGTSAPVTIPWFGSTVTAPVPFTYPVGTMRITGPLDFYTTACANCSDPWAGNHSFDALTPLSSSPSDGDPSHRVSVALSAASPSFYLHLAFDSNGAIPGASDLPYPGVYAVRRGDVANFDATLEACEVPRVSLFPVVNPDCTDYAGNSGNWQQVGSNAVAIGLPAANRGGEAWLKVSDPTPFSLGTSGGSSTGDTVLGGNPLDLVRTYRLKLHQFLQQTPSMSATTVGDRTIADDTRYTTPFNAGLVPAAVYQGKVQPYTLLYQPPGDISAPSITLQTGFGTQVEAGSSSTVSNSMSLGQSTAIVASARMGLDVQVDIGGGAAVTFGGGFDIGATKVWDSQTTWGRGTTADTSQLQSSSEAYSITWSHPADAYLVPGNGQMCSYTIPATAKSPADYVYKCQPPEIAQNDPGVAPYASFEPFWQDELILLVHPQYGVWTLNGQTRQVMLGSASFTTVTVGQLYKCATGSAAACQVPAVGTDVQIKNGQGGPPSYKGTSSSIDFTPKEALDLADLDPFFLGGGQMAALDAGRAVPLPQLSGPYGMQHGALVPDTLTLSWQKTDAQSVQRGTTVEYNMTVEDTVSSSEFIGADVNMAGTGGTLTLTKGESQTTMNQVQLSYQDSTTIGTSQTWTASGELQDCDKTYQSVAGPQCQQGHDPLVNKPVVNTFLDRKFGGLMFQDPDAPCGSYSCTHIIHGFAAATGPQSGASTGSAGTATLPAHPPGARPVVTSTPIPKH